MGRPLFKEETFVVTSEDAQAIPAGVVKSDALITPSEFTRASDNVATGHTHGHVDYILTLIAIHNVIKGTRIVSS